MPFHYIVPSPSTTLAAVVGLKNDSHSLSCTRVLERVLGWALKWFLGLVLGWFLGWILGWAF